MGTPARPVLGMSNNTASRSKTSEVCGDFGSLTESWIDSQRQRQDGQVWPFSKFKMKGNDMQKLCLALWRDESGLIMSIELVFMASIVAIGMLVGLSAYRDGVVAELADNARAVGQVNQSYNIQVNSSGPVTTDTSSVTIASAGMGGVVNITALFGAADGAAGVAAPRVSITTSFNNFFYTDTADFCENALINRDVTVVNENQPPPALLP